MKIDPHRQFDCILVIASMYLLVIAREDNPFRQHLHEVNFRASDVVLLEGPADILEENVASLGFLPLLKRRLDVGMKQRAFLSLIIFAIAIFLAAMQWVLPVKAALGGAVLVVLLLFRLLPTTRLIYDSIDWSVIVLLGAMISVSDVLQTTGGTTFIAQFISSLTQTYPPFITLSLLMIVTMA